jgi:hypothetical protein
MAGQSSPEKTAVKASAGLSPIISGALCEQENNGWGSATVVTRAACIGQKPVGNSFGLSRLSCHYALSWPSGSCSKPNSGCGIAAPYHISCLPWCCRPRKLRQCRRNGKKFSNTLIVSSVAVTVAVTVAVYAL